MNELLANLKQHWSRLAPRERLIVSAGGIVLLVIAVYLFAWEPLLQKQGQLRDSIAAQQDLYRWLQQAGIEARQLRGTSRAVTANRGTPISVINRTARASLPGAVLKRVEQSGKRGVQVWIEQVGFDDLVRWLGSLQQRNGIQVSSLVTERPGDAGLPGRVNARLILTGR